MLPLITRPGIDRRCALRDVSVTKGNAHNMRRKTQIAEQCCHGTAEIVSVPTRCAGQAMQPLRFSIPIA